MQMLPSEFLLVQTSRSSAAESRLYRFSTYLPYLLARLGMRMGELFARELAHDGLTLPMYRVLAALAEQAAPQRLGELAALTSVEASTLSRLLGQMQRMNLVTRERPERDQRSLAVDLAPAGVALAARLIPRAAHYERVATGDLSPREADKLKEVLRRVDVNLDALQRELHAGQPAPGLAPEPQGGAGQAAQSETTEGGTSGQRPDYQPRRRPSRAAIIDGK